MTQLFRKFQSNKNAKLCHAMRTKNALLGTVFARVNSKRAMAAAFHQEIAVQKQIVRMGHSAVQKTPAGRIQNNAPTIKSGIA
jgi:hypothetical protein